MAAWPKVDPEVRRRGFATLRRNQAVREAALTPVERIEQADRLMAFAVTFAADAARRDRGSDEPVELLLRMGGRAASRGGEHVQSKDRSVPEE